MHRRTFRFTVVFLALILVGCSTAPRPRCVEAPAPAFSNPATPAER